MLLTITTTYRPATDLGYLLHKHPERVQSFSLSFGRAHVFYPEASDERCTVALLLDIDPVHLVRGRRGSDALEQYVNDRPYVASSFLSVAIAEVFGTALNGRSAARQELAETPLPLQAKLAVVPCRGGEGLLRRLFEPLGYTVTAAPHMLDEQHPDWGASPYFTVTLEGNCRLRDLLTHLYVLIPVLDDDKHYFIGDEEVEKLLRHGKGWFENHPEKEQVAYRYLKHKRDLAMDAIHRLMVEDNPAHDGAEESLQGRASRQVREFALYGETTGETDEFGLPVRYNWAAEYRGKAMVIYSHTTVPEPEWVKYPSRKRVGFYAVPDVGSFRASTCLPRAKMLMAAFTSRSSSVPQSHVCQCSDKSLVRTCPQPLQTCEVN